MQIVSLDVSPHDPSSFLVATADGRVTVWRVGAGSESTPLTLHLVAALMANNVVDGLQQPWVAVAPLGTCHAVRWQL